MEADALQQNGGNVYNFIALFLPIDLQVTDEP